MATTTSDPSAMTHRPAARERRGTIRRLSCRRALRRSASELFPEIDP
ncbi:MAG: hypothetical protein U0640_01235 [Phycisphaerales bacterium]